MTRRHHGSSSVFFLAQYAFIALLCALRRASVHPLAIRFLLVPFCHHTPADIVCTNQVTAGEHDPGASFDVVLAPTSDTIFVAAQLAFLMCVTPSLASSRSQISSTWSASCSCT